VLLAAAAAILAGMVVVAMGRGGELMLFAPDAKPLDPDIVTAADVALLRPRAALWGYDRQATHVVLNMVAQTVTERDVEIAILRQQLADLQSAPQNPPARGTAGAGGAGPMSAPSPPGAGGPRQDGDARSWSVWERPNPVWERPDPVWERSDPVWERPDPAAMPDPGEQGESV
jgi:hypothetical protein